MFDIKLLIGYALEEFERIIITKWSFTLDNHQKMILSNDDYRKRNVDRLLDNMRHES